jgi:hypothetical protein
MSDCQCCEASLRLCEGLVARGSARCCADCNHSEHAAPVDWPARPATPDTGLPTLASAEATARKHVAHEQEMWAPPGRKVTVLMAEYDRRGAVERAAAAYVMEALCGKDRAPYQQAKLTALIKAVRTNRNFHG